MKLLGLDEDNWRIADLGPWLVHRLIAPSGAVVGYAVLQIEMRGIYESAEVALAAIMNHPEWFRTRAFRGESPASDCARFDSDPCAHQSIPPCAVPAQPDAAGPGPTSSDPP